MAIWEQLEVSKAHVAYACVGVFSSIFSLFSLYVKEKLYIGESTVAGIFGLIVGPVCLNWFNPLKWGNSDSITLEITRIVLCLQIFAVAVELPRKYMLKHWVSVTMLLLPVMTVGWLIIGLFVWILIPGLNFSASLLVSACVTATDPILAQSVVSGKFAQRVPGHLRNLLSAESGCNDGMAFPFIFLSMNLILHPGNGREIVKDWFCVTILYECLFGCLLGCFIGYVGRITIRFAEKKNIIDRESFLAFYVVLAFMCAGFGSILGVDDLLVSFSAGAAFAWDGWFSQKTRESNVSTVIDLLLNYAYFIYFGAIIPWSQFNNGEIGTNIWRLIILSIVVIFLRRIPAVMILRPLIPDIKSWREALFVGHFGPIGVGAIFAAILARGELESTFSDEPTPLNVVPSKDVTKHWQLIACIWPITCFFIVTSIIVHGSSVAIITLGRHLNTITLTKTFTTHTTNGENGKTSWMQRLPSLDKAGRSFSLHRMDTQMTLSGDEVEEDEGDRKGLAGSEDEGSNKNQIGSVETSGVPARPAGGMPRRKKLTMKEKRLSRRQKLRNKGRELFSSRSKNEMYDDDELNDLGRERLQKEKEARAATFALSTAVNTQRNEEIGMGGDEEEDEYTPEKEYSDNYNYNDNDNTPSFESSERSSSLRGRRYIPRHRYDEEEAESETESEDETEDESERSMASNEERRIRKMKEEEMKPGTAYLDGNRMIIENKQGEILNQVDIEDGNKPKDEEASIDSTAHSSLTTTTTNVSSGSAGKLRRILTPTSLKKIHSLVDKGKEKDKNNKYHAFKIDNLLIIENEDGDVIKRYKINPHNSGDGRSTNRSRNDSVVSRALTAVGLKSKSNSGVPPPAGVGKAMEGSSKRGPGMLKKRTLTPAPVGGVQGSLNLEDETSSGEDLGDSYNMEDSEDYDDNAYESETEFERQRRLNALGEMAAPADQDDEELPPLPVETQGGNDGPGTVEGKKKQKSAAVKSALSKTLGLNK
ncbi:Nha1p SKDI_12G1830 [Saccharomyces kudriavzevii IFO 1802]|uniref:NHA1-like protein n=1 Tax=Saccharomyces kudriavzevii (strain ATCC MYA-4449 / AS 2.2408 / CBS 8840 / NBRC 1802 / NCYC 2889) TaxID=226230 RepID=A0AA35NJP5_SACK1|nr:uncharacterized protein SKDI_12G1830 [Saccharomyces kudriavzevii IFO 1802]CAI4046162.1 hypothetical protein SKDI_12G1830 [Saccharomyces kudriavzevii IFO 1802]